jgi:hypothetical protein
MPEDLKNVINDTFSHFPAEVSVDLYRWKHFLTMLNLEVYWFLYLNTLLVRIAATADKAICKYYSKFSRCDTSPCPQSRMFNHRSIVKFMSLDFRSWSLTYNFSIWDYAAQNVEGLPFQQTLQLPYSGEWLGKVWHISYRSCNVWWVRDKAVIEWNRGTRCYPLGNKQLVNEKKWWKMFQLAGLPLMRHWKCFSNYLVRRRRNKKGFSNNMIRKRKCWTSLTDHVKRNSATQLLKYSSIISCPKHVAVKIFS